MSGNVNSWMTAAIQIRWLCRVVLWLWIAAMGFLSLPAFAYDGQGQLQAGTKISYDNSRLATVDYDGVAVLTSNECRNQPADTRTPFIKFAKFLAAEETPLILQNAANGQAFESSVINALGATKNTASISVDGLGASIPDLIDASGNTTEIKNVVNLSFTRQLQIQAQGTEGSFNLIVSPRTQYISGPLQDAVQGSGGTIQVFNPATGTLTPWP
jgi:hypothetical protein